MSGKSIDRYDHVPETKEERKHHYPYVFAVYKTFPDEQQSNGLS